MDKVTIGCRHPSRRVQAREDYLVFVLVMGTLEPCLKLQFDEEGLESRK